MKKTLLFAVAAIAAMTASAVVTPFYQRPRGSHYVAYYTTDGAKGFAGYYAPYLSVDPYATLNFKNASSAANGFIWNYQTENLESAEPGVVEDLTSTSTDLDFMMGLQTCYVPLLRGYDADGEVTYQITGLKDGEMIASKMSATPNFPNSIDVNDKHHAWMSSKYFSYKSNRDGSKTSGSYTYAIKEDNASVGALFGRNTHSRNFSGLATAFEAPVNPYMVRSVGVKFERLILADDVTTADLTVTIYAVDEIPAYDDEQSVQIVPGQVLASSTLTINNAYLDENFNANSSSGKYLGVLRFPLQKMLKIDRPVLVAFTGYNVDAIVDFSAYCSTDYYDEGYGELGYILEGSTGRWLGVNNIVEGLVGRKSAPTVFLEVERPLLYWLYPTEEGSAEVDADGELIGVELMASRGVESGNLTYTAPEWIDVELNDNIDVDYGYMNETEAIINVKVNNTTENREGDVVFSIDGCRTLKYHVSQKGNTSGVAGISDSKNVKSVHYVSPDGKMSEKMFDGVNIKVTTFSDGSKKSEKVRLD